MVTKANSEKSSLQDSMFEETLNRYSQVVLAPRCTEPEQLRVDQVARRAQSKDDGDCTCDDWLELPRVGGLLPKPLETNLLAETAFLRSEQRPLFGDPELSREHRLAQLESQRRVLSALLGTLLVGSAVLYALIDRPETGQRERLIAQLYQVNAEQRSAHEQERGRLNSRISELDARLTDIQTKLPVMRRPSTLPSMPVTTTPKTQQSFPLQASSPKEVQQAAAPKEVQQASAPKEVQQAHAPEEVQQAPASEEVQQAHAPKEVPKSPSLQEAMKSAVSKKAPQPSKAAESPSPVGPPCDKNDPLCGDLT